MPGFKKINKSNLIYRCHDARAEAKVDVVNVCRFPPDHVRRCLPVHLLLTGLWSCSLASESSLVLRIGHAQGNAHLEDTTIREGVSGWVGDV